MSLFSRKPKVEIYDFCEEFYDKYIFADNIGEVDPWAAFCETNYKLLLEADPALGAISISTFTEELRILRLEVFGIACQHKLKDKYAPLQCWHTRLYLENHERKDIWEAMLNYNKAVARSTTGGCDSNSGLGRGMIVFINQMRVSAFDKWKIVVSENDAARAANRIGSEEPWKSLRVHTYLSFEFTDILHCELNDEARSRLIAIIQGFYNGASEALSGVRIYDEFQ